MLYSRTASDAGSGASGSPDDRTVRSAFVTSSQNIDSSLWQLAFGECVFSGDFVHELNGLASLSGGCNIFFESEFQLAGANRVLPEGTRHLLLTETVGEETDFRLFLPVAPARIGITRRRAWRAASHAFAPLSLPLVEYSDREEIGLRFADLLRAIPEMQAAPLLFEDFPVDSPVAVALMEGLKVHGFELRRIGNVPRAVLLPTDSEGRQRPPRDLSRKRRREIERQSRRLEEVGKLAFETARDFWDVLVRFEEFLLLETRSWKGREGTSLHIIRQTAAFARQTIAALARQNRIAIYTLRLDGRPVASLIALRSGNRYYPWKTAYDESYRAYAPGVQLMALATEDLLSQPGFAYADSLATETSWINGYWPSRTMLSTLLVAHPQSAPGTADALERAILRSAMLKRTIRRMIRR